MERRTIALVWCVGAALALLVYVVGPDRFLQVCFAILAGVQAMFQSIMAAITVKAFELVRAAAIGLFVVFVVLGIVAARQGLRARAALVLVSVVYCMLLYPAIDGDYVSSSRWFGAFLLAAAGALVMTRRLTAALPALSPRLLRRRSQGLPGP